MKVAPSQKAKSPEVKLPILGKFVSRGDGSYVLHPAITSADTDQWITVKEATLVLGHISGKSVYRMVEDYLVWRRPVPRRILVTLSSVLRLKRVTGDTEFWNNPERRAQLREIVRAEMTRQVIEALDLKEQKAT